MTTEVSLYCTKNGVNMGDLTGVDVRSILLFNDNDLEPRTKKWFLFLTETPNKLLSEKVGNNFKYYQSIDMADSLEEVPVKGFAGTFDGQGHKIIGLSDIHLKHLFMHHLPMF